MTKLSPEQDAIVRGVGGYEHNPEDRGPLADALWAGVLAAGDHGEPKGHRSSGRGTAHYTTTEGLQAVSALFTYYLSDGTRLHRRITVTAVDEVDSDASYWDQIHENDAGAVRTDDHQHYFIGERNDSTPRGCKGFGGHQWHVKFKDGRSVYTDNLWSQGPIPPVYRELLAPNAELHSRGQCSECAWPESRTAST